MNTFRIREGIVGGIVAGMVMAMVAMLYALATQGDLLAPVKQMGALFFPADTGSVASVAAGLMLHMMTTAIFGVVFVLLARSLSIGDWPLVPGFGPIALAGMIYILIEWATAAFLILPAIDRPLLATFASVGGLVAHVMYGIVLGAWLYWRAAPTTVHVHTQQGNAA